MATAGARTEPALGGTARAHRGLALLIMVGAVAQFFLAGWAAFGAGADVWDGHVGLGSLLTLLGLFVLILAWAGRRAALQPSAVLFGLLLLQHVLGAVGREAAIVGALHPLNGLAIMGAAMGAAAASAFPPRHGRAGPAG